MMRIVGVDVSTRYVDVVSINLDGAHDPIWRRADLEKHGKDSSWTTVGRVKRAMTSANLLGSYWDNVAFVYFEDPYSQGAATGKALGLITGAVRTILPDRLQDRCERLRPNEWRALIQLPGNASKEDIAHMNTVALGTIVDDWTQDAHDAYAIALAGRTLCHQAAA